MFCSRVRLSFANIVLFTDRLPTLLRPKPLVLNRVRDLMR